eukprot:TRINITY_DN3049_c0_g1_i10.p1 TRINITY_DN3049_c0_g1~~TRINITY_DN3049_c0_g1_i10.p1  ORF type:complete len:311 (+),score=39.76 TRINITY_DN3049_c0_g1_i10:1357-2289(+)
MTNCTVEVEIEPQAANQPHVAHLLHQNRVPPGQGLKPSLKVLDLTGTVRAPFMMWRILLTEGLQLQTLLLGRSSDAVDGYVSFLQYQTELRQLDFASCLTTHRCLGAVSFMPFLEELNVNFCALDAEKLCFSLTQCTNLKVLEMQKGRNIDSGLSLVTLRFPNLQKLVLSHCSSDLTDFGMARIALLTNLEELRLAYCKKVTDLGFSEIGRSLKNLKILDLEGCLISDLGFSSFESMRRMELLEISHCENLSGQIIPLISGMDLLRSLYMDDTRIKTEELILLGKCQSLTQLVVGRILPDEFLPLWINVR